MQKRRLSFLLVSMFTFFLLAQDAGVSGEYLSGLGDKKSYKLVVKEKSVVYCETFLEAFPKSKYRKRVNELYDEVYYIDAYDVATKAFELGMLELYLEKFSDGMYRSKAEEALDIISWQKAKTTNTLPAYEAYIKRFPEGRALPLAKKAIASLKGN